MEIDRQVSYDRVNGMPEYKSSENVFLWSDGELSQYSYKTLEEVREYMQLEKRVIDDVEIEKYDKL